jgi:hypothetical protein
LLQTDDPRATLAQIYAKRHPVYALAPWRVTIEGTWSIQDTTQAVLDVLMRAGGVEKQ